MRNATRRSPQLLAWLIAAVLITGCSDSTSPTAVKASGSPVRNDGIHDCDGAYVSACTGIGDGGGGYTGGPGGGDGEGTTNPGPRDGQCLASVSVQGCDEGGNGPDPEEEPVYASDQRSGDTIPPVDCLNSNNTAWQKLYCRSSAPDPRQVTNTLQALDRIAQRGEACAVIAQIGRNLLATGGIRFFVWQQGDAGGYGHPNSGIQIDVDLVDHYDPVNNPQGSYERMLVHEIDHVLRLGHIDAAQLQTPHTSQCG